MPKRRYAKRIKRFSLHVDCVVCAEVIADVAGGIPLYNATSLSVISDGKVPSLMMIFAKTTLAIIV